MVLALLLSLVSSLTGGRTAANGSCVATGMEDGSVTNASDTSVAFANAVAEPCITSSILVEDGNDESTMATGSSAAGNNSTSNDDERISLGS